MKSNLQKLKLCLKDKFSKLTSLIFIAFPTVVFANGDTPVSQGLSYFLNAMFGATGIAIATIAIIGVGVMCMFQLFRWIVLGYAILGISIIFGAPAIVKSIVALVRFSG